MPTITRQERLKSFFYSVVIPDTAQVFRGWRYAKDRRTVRRNLRVDYGKNIQFLRLEGH